MWVQLGISNEIYFVRFSFFFVNELESYKKYYDSANTASYYYYYLKWFGY